MRDAKSRPHWVSMACSARPPGMNRHRPQGASTAARSPATASPSRTAGCGSARLGVGEGMRGFMRHNITTRLSGIKKKIVYGGIFFQVVGSKSKGSFFEKKEQKTFIRFAEYRSQPSA